MKIASALLAVTIAVSAFADQTLIEQGRAALQSDPQRAADLLEKAVQQTPNNSEAHYLLGQAYGALAQQASIFSKPGLATKTRTEFERAVQLDPNNFDARMGLISYYMMAPSFMGGDPEKAQQNANEIAKKDRIYGARAMAFIYTQQKKPDLARKVYTDLLRDQPSSAKAHYAYGVFILGNDKDYKHASQEFEAALKADPKYMPATFQVGHMAALLNTDFARGKEALQKYLAYKPAADEPPIARAHYWLGRIYELEGKRDDARQSYSTSLKLNPSQKDVAEALKRVS